MSERPQVLVEEVVVICTQLVPDPGQVLPSVIWETILGSEPPAPHRLLTLAPYKADLVTRAYVVHHAVGDRLADMPLFLVPGGCVEVLVEATRMSAVAAFPRRWRYLLGEPDS